MFHWLKTLFKPNAKQQLLLPEYSYLLDAPPANEWVCLDLELTGLDPKKHHILSVGAVKITQQNHHFVIDTAHTLSIVCRPPIMPDTNSIVIHGLRPMDVENGMNYDDMLGVLLPFISSRPVVGFCTAMDLAFINALVKPKLGTKLINDVLDVSIIEQRIRQKANKNSDLPIDKRHLNELLTAYKIPPLPAHDSLNDALMTAMLFCHLQKMSG